MDLVSGRTRRPDDGQLWHFKASAKEKLAYAIDRYEREATRILGVLDRELATRPYLVGNDYGIADIMTFPWIDALPKLGISLDQTANLARWHAAIAARPAVNRGMAVPKLDAHERAA